MEIGVNPAAAYKLVPVETPGVYKEPYQMLSDYPDVMTVKEAAKALRISEDWLRAAINRGDVASFRVGRCIKVPKSALLGFIEKGGSDESLRD